MRRHNLWGAKVVALGLALAMVAPAAAQPTPPEADRARIEQLRLETPLETSSVGNVLSPSLVDATGRRQVVVRLNERAAVQVPEGEAQVAQGARIAEQQARVLGRLRTIDPSANQIGSLRIGLNALIVDVDAAALPALARDVEVTRINAVVNYERAAQPPMETVPYIGATPEVQASGFSGKDVRVAVLDSGIDYTHAAFGGPGTLAAYEAAYGTSASDPRNTTRDGLFPTERVVEGYDFVGEVWPNGPQGFDGPLAPDPDPIDLEGHGTHVADIIGGEQGVAPAVDLYAVKVCSAVSSSCSGIAILQGLEYTADPNGDGKTDDHMHIVNMSLGASYGQNYDDDSSALVDAITPLGILVVASAGNSADRPYIVGTPSAARSALSVAQTAVPSDKVFPIRSGPATVFGIAQPWAPEPSSLISGQLIYGGAIGNNLGCTAYPAGSLTGRILLVDRGTCSVSIKGGNGAAAGALAVIVANNAAGSVPPSFGFGGGTPTVPTLSITQAAGLSLRGQSGQPATVDGAAPQSVVGSVVGTSSRGPAMGQMFYGNRIMFGQIIKPEIGAPGASISAVAGSGTGVEPFGGTSGAAPMVAGAAALVFNASNWSLSPWELKAQLMTTAETNILNGPSVFVGSGLAPITRIGGGEVRVNRAIAAQAVAWESTNRNPALSFGMIDVTGPTTLQRTVVVSNRGKTSLTFNIVPGFRFANDAATGAVTPSAPATITVPAGRQRTFVLSLAIDPTKLQPWTLDSGPRGGNGDALTVPEYDGYLTLDAPGTNNDLNLPWHVLPRAAGRVSAPASVALRGGTATVNLANSGAVPVAADTFTLIGSNPFVTASSGAGQQGPQVDLRFVGVQAFPGAGVCPADSPIIQFAVNTHQRYTHANYPVQIELRFDTNRDGETDFIGFTGEAGTFASSGQNLFFVQAVGATTASAFFFTDHRTNSANSVATICGSQIGVGAVGQQINVSAYLFDNYFTGREMSKIEGMSTVIGAPRFNSSFDIANVPAAGTLPLTITSTAAVAGTTDSGVLLIYNYGREGNEASAIRAR